MSTSKAGGGAPPRPSTRATRASSNNSSNGNNNTNDKDNDFDPDDFGFDYDYFESYNPRYLYRYCDPAPPPPPPPIAFRAGDARYDEGNEDFKFKKEDISIFNPFANNSDDIGIVEEGTSIIYIDATIFANCVNTILEDPNTFLVVYRLIVRL